MSYLTGKDDLSKRIDAAVTELVSALLENYIQYWDTLMKEGYEDPEGNYFLLESFIEDTSYGWEWPILINPLAEMITARLDQAKPK